MTATMKLCIDCKYYRFDTNFDPDSNDAWCINAKSPVNGKYARELCSIRRSPLIPSPIPDDYHCGPEARMFEVKDGTPTITGESGPGFRPVPKANVVYVVYADYGSYEGCGKPLAAFPSEAEAALYIVKTHEGWKDNVRIAELTVGGGPPLTSAAP